MMDLQTALVHDDALDNELQYGWLVGQRSMIEPTMDALQNAARSARTACARTC
jgi:hypothetical protein